jgi:hypothetical protein
MAAWAEFSGRRTFPAADSRARCVLTDGWPVLSVHFSLGSARQVGQRTDNICRTVSSDFTLALFTIANQRQKPQIERRAALCYTNPAKHFKLQTTVNPAIIPKTYPSCTLETLPTGYRSVAARRRSRCGSVRGRPVLSSHLSPGLAPQVGQRTLRICFSVGFTITSCMAAQYAADQF